MSVVAGKKQGKTLQMAADTLCTLPEAANIQRLDSKKLFVSDLQRSKILWGSVGEFVGKQSFLKFLDIYSREVSFETNEHVDNSLRRFQQFLKETDRTCDGTMFMLGCRAGLFTYQSDGELNRYKDFTAMGAGGKVAYTALHLGHEPQEAVQAAIDLETKCGGKVHAYKIRL